VKKPGNRKSKGDKDMRKIIFVVMATILFCITVFQPIKYTFAGSVYDNQIVYVTNYIQSGDTDYTNAIIRADESLKSKGGGTLIFPEGNYKIKPDKILISSNIMWKGVGSARIYAEETSLYNRFIGTESGAYNIKIANIIFDQRGDIAQKPDISLLKGCIILHIADADQVFIDSCTFYTYGVCAILVQSHYYLQTNYIEITNNKAYFKKTTNTFYDVSVFNIDGRTVKVENNYVEGIYIAGYSTWKPRSAFEIHSPNGSIQSNTTLNVELGILSVNWPTLWNTFETEYTGAMIIKNNKINKAIVGIDLWSTGTIKGTTTQNVTISDNYIDLYLDGQYFPGRGISISNGAVADKFRNIVIDNNDIVMTVAPTITDAKARMNLLVTGSITGAISLIVASQISDVIISNNNITNFVYAFLNFYRQNEAGQSLQHNNVKVFSNTIKDTAYTLTYGGIFDAVYNIGYTNNISIYNNIIIEENRKSIEYLRILEGVTLLKYAEGTLTDLTSKVYTNVIGTWANARQIYVTNVAQCAIGDKIITPNNETTYINNVAGNYIYTTTDVTSWYGGKMITCSGTTAVAATTTTTAKTYTNVIGTWANARQIYVTNVAQCAIGDKIITPNNETTYINNVAGNYIYTTTDVTSWYGGKTMTCSGTTTPAATTTTTTTTTIDKTYTNVIGTWANARQIYVTNVAQCAIGDKIITPNNETTYINSVAGNYIYTTTDVTSWYGGKMITCSGTTTVAAATTTTAKTYTNVIGTWANARQIYVTNVAQCVAGDKIITPNNETTYINNVAGNYIYTTTDVTSWYGGKMITCSGTTAVAAATTTAKTYTNVIGTWANARQIYVTNVAQCVAGDKIITPNNETTYINNVAGNYIYTTSDVTSWYGGKVMTCAGTTVIVIRTYTNVIGTWANARQIYVTNVAQCITGDKIITPNSQTTYIDRVAGNYIYTTTDVSSWYGGKEIKLQ
jgi:hypothetical protein